MMVRVSCALAVCALAAGCGNAATPVDAMPDLAPISADADLPEPPADLATPPPADLASTAPDLQPGADLAPLPPELLWFVATPDSKPVGDEAELRWKLRKPADAVMTCTLAFNDDAGTELVLPDCPAEGASYHRYLKIGDYRPKLTVRIKDGALVAAKETVLHVTQPFTVTILAPQAGSSGRYSDFDVEARVTSPLPLKSVTARIESATATLGYDHGVNGDLDYKGPIRVPYGTKDGLYSLVVTATDDAGQTASATIEIAVDEKAPTLIIRAPFDDTVATPATAFDVACTDGVPGCTVSVSTAGGAILASGADQLQQKLSFDAAAGKMVTVTISATNRGGRINQRTRRIFVEPSQALNASLHAPATIESVNGNYVLYFDRHDSGVYTQPYEDTQPTGLLWASLSPWAATPVPLRSQWYGSWGRRATAVALPNGALFVDVYNGNGGVMQWKTGDAVASLLTTGAVGELRASGDYVAWSNWATGSSSYRISTGQLSTLPASDSIDVSPTGKIAYTSPMPGHADCNIPHDAAEANVFLDGKQLTSDTKYWNSNVVTDGEIVAYSKWDPCTLTYAVAMHDGTKEELLVDFGVFTREPVRDQDFRVNGKFAAFVVPQKGSAFEVWERTPMGNRGKLVALSGTAELEGLATYGGRLMFVQHDLSGGAQRYGIRSDGSILAVGSGLGQGRWANDRYWQGIWLVRIGRSEFSVNNMW